MNKREVISTVAERSGVSPEDCTKVLEAFEEVFSEEITRSKWKGTVFEYIYDILTRIRSKKNNRNIA